MKNSYDRAGKGLTVDRRREGGRKVWKNNNWAFFKRDIVAAASLDVMFKIPPIHTCHWAESDQPVWRAGLGGASAWWRPLDWRTPRTGSRFRGQRGGRTHWRCGPPHPWRSCPCWWWCNSSAGRPWTPGSPGLGCLTETQTQGRGVRLDERLEAKVNVMAPTF